MNLPSQSMPRALGIMAFGFALVLMILQSNAATQKATVIQVLDGDTVRLHDSREVRLLGIDAPEKGDPFSEEATLALNKLVGSREVRLETGRTAKDHYGRLLAYVFVGKALVNEEQVRQGWAHVRRPVAKKFLKQFLGAQEEARIAGRGFWSSAGNISLVLVKVNAKADKNSLNNEYIVLKNGGSKVLEMTGWSVLDESNRRYLFPNFSLAPGAMVTLRTGSGKNTPTDLYWGNRSAIWNDEGDSIFIKNAEGRLVLSHVY